MWLVFAILSAVFAACTSILAKVGIDGVDSNLATAIRTVVVLILAWVMVFVSQRVGHPSGSLAEMIRGISNRSWLFLILSGLATGASWLCYFYAIKVGDVSKVVPVDKCSLVLTVIFAVIFLGESFTWKTALGCVLMLAGSFLMIL
ncbi:MAG: EamA family transporter [Candidatus Cryptobacteroides sp.]